MREADAYGIKLCTFQAEIFRESLARLECGSKIFVRRFLFSETAARMDTKGFIFESVGTDDVFDELEQQYGVTSYGRMKYSTEEMYWIGYLYRYWAYTYEKSSKQLFKFIKPEELSRLYYPYHSMDPSQAIERILEAKGATDQNQIERGVIIMRRIRSGRSI